jgi:uroporphyrinogen-III synthase
MRTWYSVSLGDGLTSGTPAAEIEAAFERTLTDTSSSADRAVFTRPESEGRLHCEVIAYFSPATAALAKQFGAEPCVKPSRAGLALLAGDEMSWSVLFAGEG